MRAIFAPQFIGHPEKRPKEHRPIIVREVDEFRLHDKAAEFDQLARAFAALDLPIAHAGSRLRHFKPMPHCR